MPTKFPYLILSSQGTLHTVALSPGTPIASPLPSSHHPPYRPAPHTRSPLRRSAHPTLRNPPRRYASTHSSTRPPDSDLDPSWPHAPAPSPYDILHQRRGAPYCRRRFLRLVKIYHPDRQNGTSPATPRVARAVCVERYRLAVTAHEILRDPARRRAYDASGAGWRVPVGPRAGGYTAASTTTTAETWAYARDGSRRPWTSRDADGPFHNATWEDWEAWYERTRNRRRRHASSGSPGGGGDGWGGSGWSASWDRAGSATSRPGTVLANGTSVLLILLTAFVGIHEVRRAEKRSKAYVAQLEKTHRAANKELRHRQEGSRTARQGEGGWLEGFLRGGNSGHT